MKRFGEKIYKQGEYDIILDLFIKNKPLLSVNTVYQKHEETELCIHFLNGTSSIIIIKDYKKVNSTKLKKYISFLLEKSEPCNTYILKPDHVKNIFLKTLNILPSHIYSFHEILLQINKHKTQPLRVKIMNNNEVKIVLDMYNIEKENLPKLNYNDVLCKYYNIQINDVIEIQRKDSFYYRLCIG